MDFFNLMENVGISIFASSIYSVLIEPILQTGKEKVVETLRDILNSSQKEIEYLNGKKIKISELQPKVKELILDFVEENPNYLNSKEIFIKEFVNFLKKSMEKQETKISYNGIANEGVVLVGNFENRGQFNINVNSYSKESSKKKIPSEIGDFAHFKDKNRDIVLGRDKEIEELKKLLEKYRIINIFGIAGIGKTSVAKVLYNEIKDYYDYRLILILSNPESDSVESLQEKFVREISYLLKKLKLYNPIEEEKSLKEKFKKAIDLLDDPNYFGENFSKLIIIDNIISFSKNHADKETLKLLFGIDKSKFILTSREKLNEDFYSGLKNFELKPLSLEDSLKIFYFYFNSVANDEKLLGKLKKEEDKIKELIEKIQRNTFFIEIFAKVLGYSYPYDLTVDTILGKIEKLELPKVEVYLEEEHIFKEYYDKLLKIAWNLLKEDEKLLLKKLSLLPSNYPISFEFLKEYLQDIKLLKPKLTTLSNKGWVKFQSNNLEIHQIVKDFLLYSTDINFKVIEPQLSFLEEKLRNIKDLEYVLKLMEVIPLEILESAGTSLYLLIDNLDQEDKKVFLPIFLGKLGIVFYHLGKYNKAEEYFLKALEIREEVLPSNHPDLASTYHDLGVLYLGKGEYNKAEEYFLKALEIW